MIVVVSTGYAPPTLDKHNDSLRTQTVTVVGWLRDAACQDPPRAATDNVVELVQMLKDDVIVVWLDLDDWLAHDDVIGTIERLYARNPDLWLTYGSYEHADGRPGCASEYPSDNYREDQWRASHLRTFRAGLFKRIKVEDLKDSSGQWLRHCVDQAIMLPMLEMAGPKHIKFCPEILAIYNYASSFEHNATPEQLAEERRALQYVRSRPPYARLEAL